MKLLNKILILFIIFNFSFANSKPVPESFADLADQLMPSVVNISTTQTVRTSSNQFPFQFPPGSPFEEMFKELSPKDIWVPLDESRINSVSLFPYNFFEALLSSQT